MNEHWRSVWEECDVHVREQYETRLQREEGPDHVGLTNLSNLQAITIACYLLGYIV